MQQQENTLGDDEDEKRILSGEKKSDISNKDDDSDDDLFGQDDDEVDTTKRKNCSEKLESSERDRINDQQKERMIDNLTADKKSGPGVFELDRKPFTEPVMSPVPRKSQTTAASSPQQIPRKSKIDIESLSSPIQGVYTTTATELGLPEGALIPETVSVSLLEGRILETLKQLPANLISDALQEYDDAVKQQKNIRSHGAYLFGVLKRYLSVHQSAGGSMGQKLTPIVQERLNKLVRDGFCTQDEMNEKVKSKIRMLSEKDALFAIEEFAGVDRASIRNFGSYFMGILNRYMRGDRSTKDRRGSNRHQDNSTGGMGKSNRRYQRGRSPDRDYRSRRGYGASDDRIDYRRERSRDDPNRKHNDRSNYESHHQYQHKQHNHYGPSSASIPPPPPPRQNSLGQQQHSQSTFLHQTNHSIVPDQGFHSGGTAPFNPQFSAPSIVGSQQQANTMANTRYPPPPPTGYNAVPVINSRPSLQTGFSNPNQDFPPVPGPHNPTMPSWQSPQQQGPMSGQDILGIAAKAAQALAANQNLLQSNISVQQQQAQNFTSQHAAFRNAAAQEQLQHNHSQQTQSIPPVRRGRTVAKMHELPIAVQFAVQNLQAIGHIEGPLDEGILGMIKDLPEQLALAALSRFSSLDKSAMRNTTAYLAGVLRRELEKIQRR